MRRGDLEITPLNRLVGYLAVLISTAAGRELVLIFRPALAHRSTAAHPLNDGFVIAPARRGVSLPGRSHVFRHRGAKVQKTSLGPGICIDSKRVIVLPINMQPPRNFHDRGGAVSLALICGGLIFGRIPGVCGLAALEIERNTDVIAFVRHDHAVAPVLGDHRYPIPREILRRIGSCCCCRRSLGSIARLSANVSGGPERKRCRE